MVEPYLACFTPVREFFLGPGVRALEIRRKADQLGDFTSQV
jgi:hypothetical protein